MSFGLYGKVPSKRDFIAINVDHGILAPFETWLQSVMAASQKELGREWISHYLVAPIWHFWIGKAVLGNTCMGAIMPSVDKVGRYFPLSILYMQSHEYNIKPIFFSESSAWFHALDEFLLRLLEENDEQDFKSLLSEVDKPPMPELLKEREGSLKLRNGLLFTRQASQEMTDFSEDILEYDSFNAMEHRSYWWNHSEEQKISSLMSVSELPDPYDFSRVFLGKQ